MGLPSLDCHAHVSPSVTNRQIAQLGTAIVFAMTREPAEAVEAAQRRDHNILWGCGAHPSYVARGGAVDLDEFDRCATGFAIVGEIGMDRRSGNLHHQAEVFDALLDRLKDEPVLLSVHSAGCTAEVAKIVRLRRTQGVIMHWFSGRPEEVDELLSLGCYFSVNTAMRREILTALPLDRLLPETDFPVARRRTGSKPGDTDQLEKLLAEIHDSDPMHVRRQFYRNLRRMSVGTGAIDRMPMHVADLLLAA
ncbi:hydrolase TatD [Mycobacterium liflandii]|nr:putative deoxyribonuclease YcfH [Mycobacterium marinum]ULL10421.1 hydrolase TatD [Mycobacterium liflandii]